MILGTGVIVLNSILKRGLDGPFKKTVSAISVAIIAAVVLVASLSLPMVLHHKLFRKTRVVRELENVSPDEMSLYFASKYDMAIFW